MASNSGPKPVALQPVEQTAMTPFQPRGMEEALKLAHELAQSSLLPTTLRGKPSDVLVTLLTGHELGLSPMQSIRGMHVIEGKAVMSADLMVALVQRHRDVCQWFRMVETTDQRAVYETQRAGNPEPTRMTFTLDQAKAAGLTSKNNWKTYPAAMLRARCASMLARAVYPDLCLGVYDSDEAENFRPAPAVAYKPPAEPVDAEFTESKAPAEPDLTTPLLASLIDTAQDVETLDGHLEKLKAQPEGPEKEDLRKRFLAKRKALKGEA